MHVQTTYAHMHVQTTHTQTCLHVARANMWSSLLGPLLAVCIPACICIHTHMHIQTTHEHGHRVNSWSSLTGSPKKAKPGKGLTILADTEAPIQSDSAASPVERDLMAPKRLGSVRFAADHLQPDSPSGSSITGVWQVSVLYMRGTYFSSCQLNTLLRDFGTRSFLSPTATEWRPVSGVLCKVYQEHVAHFNITLHAAIAQVFWLVSMSTSQMSGKPVIERISGSRTAGIRNCHPCDKSQGLMLCVGVCRAAAGLPKGTDAGFSSCSPSTPALQSTARAEAVLPPTGGHLTSRYATQPITEHFGSVVMLHRQRSDQQWCCVPCMPWEYL